MRIRTLDATLWLPLPREQVFTFFSDAGNLDALTPPWLSFQILTPRPIPMFAGARIDYQLRIHGIPIRWRTVIRVWDPPSRFVDEQESGPYRQWHHSHTFEEIVSGTCIHDHVEYAVPIQWLEPLVHFFVARDNRAIFAYRLRKIRELLAPGSSAERDRLVIA